MPTKVDMIWLEDGLENGMEEEWKSLGRALEASPPLVDYDSA